MSNVILLNLILIIIFTESITTQFTFEPDTKSCSDIDNIDHCCSCNYCDGTHLFKFTNYSSETTKLDITPYTSPLPSEKENLGTSMDMYGTRVVADNHPDYNEDQTLGETTTTISHSIEYNEDLNQWVHIGLEDTPEGQGHVVKCSENYVIIGNPSADPANAALFVRTPNPSWSLSLHLKEVEKESEYGYAVDLDENNKRVIISDPSYRNEVGRVYVYLTYSDIIIDTLDHPNPFSEDNPRFGHSIAIEGNLAIVSSPNDDINGHQNVGSVHLFQQETGGTKWFHVKSFNPSQLQAAHLTTGRKFGWKIALHKRYFIVGSLHSQDVEVYYQSIENDINSFVYMQTLNAPGMTMISKFGTALDIFENRIVVSDPNFLSSPSALGKVFIYEYSTKYNEWLHCQTFVDDPTSFHTHFGQSVALGNERYLAVSAPDTDSTDNGNGKIWLFDLDRSNQCSGCDGIINSCMFGDFCGICDGDNTTCSGCDGIPNSGKEFDYCNVCGGDNSTCLFTESKVVVEDICNDEALYKFDHEPAASSVYWMLKEDSLFGEVTILNNKTGSIKYVSQLKDLKTTPENDVFVLIMKSSNESTTIPEVEVIVTVNIKPCLGCDGIPNSGTKEDICGVCGGDGTSCIDCDGIVNGNKVMDYCNKCVATNLANRTCLHIHSVEEPQIVKCGQTMCFGDIKWDPNYPNSHLKWTVVKEPTHGKASIGYHSGEITYEHDKSSGNINNEEIWIKAEDNYKNIGAGKISVKVTGCDIMGCDNVLGSGNIFDKCGVCGGTDDCVDCFGIINGGAKEDLCGICGGNNSTCPDKVLLAQITLQNAVANEEIPIAIWIAIGLSLFGVLILIACYFIYFSSRKERLIRNISREPPGYYYPGLPLLPPSIQPQPKKLF